MIIGFKIKRIKGDNETTLTTFKVSEFFTPTTKKIETAIAKAEKAANDSAQLWAHNYYLDDSKIYVERY